MKRIGNGSSKASSKVRLEDSVDFGDLFDGDTWLLRQGEDFQCSASSAASLVRAEFRTRYGHLVVRQIEEGGTAIQVTATRGDMWRKA